jgi:CRISPR-associated protein Cas2
MHVVISYDIVEDGRRNKISDLLKDYGTRVQYSVFECDINNETLRALINQLDGLIDQRDDSIRVYMICEGCLARKVALGKTEELGEKRFFLV